MSTLKKTLVIAALAVGGTFAFQSQPAEAATPQVTKVGYGYGWGPSYRSRGYYRGPYRSYRPYYYRSPRPYYGGYRGYPGRVYGGVRGPGFYGGIGVW